MKNIIVKDESSNSISLSILFGEIIEADSNGNYEFYITGCSHGDDDIVIEERSEDYNLDAEHCFTDNYKVEYCNKCGAERRIYGTDDFTDDRDDWSGVKPGVIIPIGQLLKDSLIKEGWDL